MEGGKELGGGEETMWYNLKEEIAALEGEEDWNGFENDKKEGIETKEESGRKRMRDDDIKEPIVTGKGEEKWEEEGGRRFKESWSNG